MKLLLPIILTLTGCSVASIRPEITHVSHISQHFGANKTNYGYDEVAIDLHLEPVRHLEIDIAEGVVLEGKSDYGLGYGALVGPRETFSATIGYDIPLHN